MSPLGLSYSLHGTKSRFELDYRCFRYQKSLLLLLFYSDSPEFCFLLLLNQAQLIIVLSAFFSISHSYSSAFVDLTITIYCFLLLSHKSINKHSLMTIFFIHNSRHQNL